jgi:hypothetical protein
MTQTEIFGSVPTSIKPFDNQDLLYSFFDGIIWGGFVLSFLALGAWIISIARSRVNFAPRTRNFDHARTNQQFQFSSDPTIDVNDI